MYKSTFANLYGFCEVHAPKTVQQMHHRWWIPHTYQYLNLIYWIMVSPFGQLIHGNRSLKIIYQLISLHNFESNIHCHCCCYFWNAVSPLKPLITCKPILANVLLVYLQNFKWNFHYCCYCYFWSIVSPFGILIHGNQNSQMFISLHNSKVDFDVVSFGLLDLKI